MWGLSPLLLPGSGPLTQIIGVSLDYSSHGVAPPAWLPWALTTLFFSFSASGLESVITEITHADDVKCPKLKRVYPEKDKRKVKIAAKAFETLGNTALNVEHKPTYISKNIFIEK